MLAIFLEFDTWQRARTWSYASSYGLLDGLESRGCQVTVLPSLSLASFARQNPWVDARTRLLARRRFDQAWVWITHSHYEPAFWRWLRMVAPVRVGVVMESLSYTEAEYAEAPELRPRRAEVLAQLEHMTHVLTGDEEDLADIEATVRRPARLYHPMLPRRMITGAVAPRAERPGFLGTLYPKRRAFLEKCAIGDELAIIPAPEADSGLPIAFDMAQRRHLEELRLTGGSPELLQRYVAAIREIRTSVQLMTLAAYRTVYAAVDLPAFYRGIPGRVVDAMAAGTPVLSDVSRSQPALETAFVNGRDILYYDADDPGHFARCLHQLRDDFDLRSRLVAGAQEKLLSRFCSEAQIGAILDWIGRPSRLAAWGWRACSTWRQIWPPSPTIPASDAAPAAPPDVEQKPAPDQRPETDRDLVAPYFDASYYRESNPGVTGDPLTHFLTSGWREGRNPSSVFDVGYYLACNPDVAEAGINPVVHYARYGLAEGRRTRPANAEAGGITR